MTRRTLLISVLLSALFAPPVSAGGGAPVANPIGPLETTSSAPASDLAAEPVEAPVANPVPVTVPPAPDGDTSQPSEARVTEALPLGRPVARPAREAAESGPAESDGSSWASHPVFRTAGALTVVLSIIFGLRSLIHAFAKRGAGLTASLGAGGRAPSGVLSVLGRYPIGRGVTLVLLQLDRRVLLLSQSSTGFQTLCELTDAEDVASIVRKTADDEGVSLSKRFSAMLGKFERDPSITGDGSYEVPLSPRRAMAVSEYEASLQVGRDAPPDTRDVLRRRLDRLAGDTR